MTVFHCRVQELLCRKFCVHDRGVRWLDFRCYRLYLEVCCAGPLRCQHGDQLKPAVKRPKLYHGVVLVGKSMKFISRKNPYYSKKNDAIMSGD